MLTQQAGKVENRQDKTMRLTNRIGQTTYKVNVYFSETSMDDFTPFRNIIKNKRY